MMNIFRRPPLRLMLLLAVSAALGQASRPRVSVKTSLSSETVPLNGEVVFSIELSWPGALDAVRLEDPGEPGVNNLMLRGSGASNRIVEDSLAGRRSLKRFDFYFKPRSVGRAHIKPMTLAYRFEGRREVVRTDALFLRISAPREEQRPVFMPGSILLWLLLFLFMAAALFVTVRYVMLRRKHRPRATPGIREKYQRLLLSTIHPENGQDKENRAEILRLLDSFLMESLGQIHIGGMEQRLEMLASVPGDETARARLAKTLQSMGGITEERHIAVQRLFDEVNDFLKDNI